MKIEDVRRLIQRRANDGFIDATIKFSEVDDLVHVIDALEKGGYLLGLRCDQVDCLYVAWVQRGHFLTRWVENLDEYMGKGRNCNVVSSNCLC